MTAAPSPDNAGVIAPPPLIVLGFLIAGLILDRVCGLGFSPWWAVALLGWVLIVAAVGLASLAIRTMKRKGTPLDPRRPTAAIVETGPYGFSRNPIYLAFLLLYAGVALTEGSIWLALLFAPLYAALRYGVVAREERYLERKFGGDYLGYKARVRRWL